MFSYFEAYGAFYGLRVLAFLWHRKKESPTYQFAESKKRTWKSFESFDNIATLFMKATNHEQSKSYFTSCPGPEDI